MKVMTVWLDGLWDRNPGLVQLLGLCPLLAVSNTIDNAVGLGLATIFVLVLSNASISLIRHLVEDAIRLPVFVLIIATLTTCAELLIQAFDYSLYQSLGIFLPLIVTNCLIQMNRNINEMQYHSQHLDNHFPTKFHQHHGSFHK